MNGVLQTTHIRHNNKKEIETPCGKAGEGKTPSLLLTELWVMRRKGRSRWIINYPAKVDGDVYPNALAFSKELLGLDYFVSGKFVPSVLGTTARLTFVMVAVIGMVLILTSFEHDKSEMGKSLEGLKK